MLGRVSCCNSRENCTDGTLHGPLTEYCIIKAAIQSRLMRRAYPIHKRLTHRHPPGCIRDAGRNEKCRSTLRYTKYSLTSSNVTRQFLLTLPSSRTYPSVGQSLLNQSTVVTDPVNETVNCRTNRPLTLVRRIRHCYNGVSVCTATVAITTNTLLFMATQLPTHCWTGHMQALYWPRAVAVLPGQEGNRRSAAV